MILHCYGDDCPLRDDCYRFTQPSPGRDAFGSPPYDAPTGTCEYFYSNDPSEELIRTTAYYLWLREGCPEQQAERHWQQAYESLCEGTGRRKPLADG